MGTYRKRSDAAVFDIPTRFGSESENARLNHIVVSTFPVLVGDRCSRRNWIPLPGFNLYAVQILRRNWIVAFA